MKSVAEATICFLTLFLVSDAAQWWTGLHEKMSAKELNFYFGTSHSDNVDPQAYEVAYLTEATVSKRGGSTSAMYYSLRLTAFDTLFSLDDMVHNEGLLAPHAKAYTKTENQTSRIISLSRVASDCKHFTFSGGRQKGGLSKCRRGEFRGFVTSGDDVFDVAPLEGRLLGAEAEESRPHLIRRSSFAEVVQRSGVESKLGSDLYGRLASENAIPHLQKRGGGGYGGEDAKKRDLIVETFIVVDPEAFDKYMDFYDHDEQRVLELVLVVVNGIQSLYHYPSLGRIVDFSIVRLELQQREQFDEKEGERGGLLTSFCDYQGKDGVYVEEDADEDHFDLAVLLSGLDFWAYESPSSGQKSHTTMGLSTVTGVCDRKHDCVIGEIGVENENGNPYPSCGFTVVYVLAHEVGHNLGLHHDSSDVYNQPLWFSCERNGYIMSPTRNTFGEVRWSKCSRTYVADLDLPCLQDRTKRMPEYIDHERLGNVPGNYWDTKKQCQMLLRDEEAYPDDKDYGLEKICAETLICRSPKRIGLFHAGPALEGSRCGGPDFHCIAGECKKIKIEQAVQVPTEWSEWSAGACKYNCIKGSKGVSLHRRRCLRGDCKEPKRKVMFCTDYSTAGCEKEYSSKVKYATAQCKKFSKNIESIREIIGEDKIRGGQSKYSEKAGNKRPCQIGCVALEGGLYHPVVELDNNKRLSPYFPDGTLCHKDGESKYYCRRRRCVPDGRGRRGARAQSQSSPKLPILQMASPDGEGGVEGPAPDVQKYFTGDGEQPPPPREKGAQKGVEYKLD